MRPDRFDRFFIAAAPAALGIWICACVWYPLTDTDIWWHLAAAKLMWARKAFLRVDPFSLSSLGAPWTDLHWGFQFMAYGLWKLGGAPALVAGKCAALAGAVGLALLPHWNRRSAYFLLPLAAYGFFQIRFYVDVRPLAVTLLVLAGQYAAMMAHFRGRFRRPWLVVAPLQLVLVNTQGLFPLGAVLVTCLVAGEWSARADRGDSGGSEGGFAFGPLAVTCVFLWLSGFANPYGWDGFKLPLSLFGRITPSPGNVFSAEIAENKPFLELLVHNPVEAFPFACFMVAVLFTFDRAKIREGLGHLALFIAFAGLGMMAVRNLPLTFLAGLMAAGRNLQVSASGARGNPEGDSQDDVAPNGAFLRSGGIAAFAFVLLVFGPDIRHAWAFELPGTMLTPFRFPVQAVDFLESHPVPGPVFNELRYGGYLEFRMHPREPAFVDGRMILRSAAFYADFLAAVDHPEGFAQYRARYGFTHALLPISEERRFLPLAAYLVRESGWDLLQCDGAGVLLSAPGQAVSWALPLDSLPPGHPVRTAIHARFGANPRLEALALRNASDFLAAAGRGRAARDVLMDASAIATFDK
jgi:hypothetical protein